MTRGDAAEGRPVPAGTFSSWLIETGRARDGDAAAAVPCGECTGCCTSSQFVHVGPDEVATIRRIPRALLFPAPGMPRGNVLMGYDENGHCPMFVDGRCSIYEHRPRTCRTYDCRVFPAAGVELADSDKAQITERTRRWEFDFPSERDRSLHAAVRSAASFLRAHADQLPQGAVPRHPTQLAFLAVEIHGVFLEHDDDGKLRPAAPPLDVVLIAVRRARTGPAA